MQKGKKQVLKTIACILPLFHVEYIEKGIVLISARIYETSVRSTLGNVS